MKLIDKRVLFSGDLAAMLLFGINDLGYRIILDETKRSREAALWNATHCRVISLGVRCERTPEEHARLRHKFKPIGIAESTHVYGLGADLYVIRDGAISNERRIYAKLGDFWKSIRPTNFWGGDFEGFPDLGHFSREHQGRR